MILQFSKWVAPSWHVHIRLRVTWPPHHPTGPVSREQNSRWGTKVAVWKVQLPERNKSSSLCISDKLVKKKKKRHCMPSSFSPGGPEDSFLLVSRQVISGCLLSLWQARRARGWRGKFRPCAILDFTLWKCYSKRSWGGKPLSIFKLSPHPTLSISAVVEGRRNCDLHVTGAAATGAGTPAAGVAFRAGQGDRWRLQRLARTGHR